MSKIINKRLKFFIVGLIIVCAMFTLTIFYSNNQFVYAYASDEEANSDVEYTRENFEFNEEQANNTNLLDSDNRNENLWLVDENPTDECPAIRRCEVTNLKFIPNANYFIINPKHTRNNPSWNTNIAGVCTTIAMQLLMGYHNYYSDGRLIPAFSEDHTLAYLDEDYGNPYYHPVLQRDSVENYGCPKIGTTDGLFTGLFNEMLWPQAPLFGQMVGVVKRGCAAFIQHNTRPSEIVDDISLTDGLFSQTTAQTDIDAGNPIILGMHPFNDEQSFHVVVAYGYAKLDGTDGFLVHMGDNNGGIYWVPSSWFLCQLRMSVNTHTHNFVPQNVNVNDMYKVLECSVCGVKTLDSFYDINNGKIERVK